MSQSITTIGLDADDTLWHNENIFETHHKIFCDILSDYHDTKTVEKQLFDIEMKNLNLYGYGIKSFTLSSIETAIKLTEGKIDVDEIKRIIERCKEMLDHPVELLGHVPSIVQQLSESYRLILITKGDLRDQERKIARSGLAQCFEATEIVSEKTSSSYARILQRHSIDPKQFLMVGNSLKSDILPVLDLGGYGVHIPYATTWIHERVDSPPAPNSFFHQLDSIEELPPLLEKIG
ncbi:HAD family hydrolase [Puniceicoccaceae bacterium K14]|nr:HAD family hydrolase [Puniceicoccaceae bacterium K14]